MVKQQGGGSVGQSLRYVDPAAPEQTAGAGSNLLHQQGLVVRPAIGGATRKRKGGFYPSVMAGIVDSGVLSLPLAGYVARRMLSRKTRKGGGKRGERWLAEREEAKSKLLEYGKPSAQNIQKYAIAKRRGSEAAAEVLEAFRKKKQEKAEANEAKRQARQRARNEKKAAKQREREERKAAKAATKKNKPPRKERTKKAKPEAAKGTHLFFNNEGRVITKARNEALASLAERVASPASKKNKPARKERTKKVKHEMPKGTHLKFTNEGHENRAPPKAEEKTRKSPSNKSKKYFEELKKARLYLSTVGAPTGPNMSKYVSMLMKGENTKAWIENFKTRRPLGTVTKKAKKPGKPKTPEMAKPKTPNSPRPNTPKTPNAPRPKTPEMEKPKASAAPKTKKSPSNKSKKYFEELKKARLYLSTVGAPTGPNMSKYVSMTMKGENTKAWIENFKTRRPLGTATKKSRKPKTTAAASSAAAAEASKPKSPKPLTAVKEENESENENNE